MTTRFHILTTLGLLLFVPGVAVANRALRFAATQPAEAARWQEQARAKLFALMMGGAKPERPPLDVRVLQRIEVPDAAYVWEELSLQTLPDRRVHAWLARPKHPQGRVGAVLALHGHGGRAAQVVRGEGLYWYGRTLAEMGHVVIAPDIGQHALQHTNWTLLGEWVWDALRCVDYLETRPEVDRRCLAVVGLSLGGETAMYAAALDPRLRIVCSSGWLTTVQNLKQGHCPCWNFPGLEEHFDFADIFACVAPRALILEIGEQERAPGGFPLDIARGAFREIQAAYRVFGAETNVLLDVHPAGHVFRGRQFWRRLPRSNPTAWLEQTTRRLLAGCRVRAHDGTWLYTPDSQGHYAALWTRDFAYMVENAGDLLPPAEVEACLRYLIRGIRADGAAPDRVQADGRALYVGGPADQPLGEPNLDNPAFLVIAVDEHLRRLPRAQAQARFGEWAGPLEKAMDWVPRSPAGLVWNDPSRPHSPYGFTDTVGKTGELLFESLLDWTASRRLAAWYRRGGNRDAAEKHGRRAAQIERHLELLWDAEAGAFFAASRDCRQLDIWGNAYAIWLDFPLGRKRDRVLSFLQRRQDDFVWRGQVRHLLKGQHWQRLLLPIEPERYQNGAYWATAAGWVLYALAQTDPAQARQRWHELIADFCAEGVCECVNEGYRQLPGYVASATNPLAAARRLRY